MDKGEACFDLILFCKHADGLRWYLSLALTWRLVLRWGRGWSLQPEVFYDFCLKPERSFVTFDHPQTPPLITAYAFSYGKDQPIRQFEKNINLFTACTLRLLPHAKAHVGHSYTRDQQCIQWLYNRSLQPLNQCDRKGVPGLQEPNRLRLSNLACTMSPFTFC